MKVSAL